MNEKKVGIRGPVSNVKLTVWATFSKIGWYWRTAAAVNPTFSAARSFWWSLPSEDARQSIHLRFKPWDVPFLAMTDLFPNNPWTKESKVGPSSKSGLLTIYCNAVGSETIKRFFYPNDEYRTLCNCRRGRRFRRDFRRAWRRRRSSRGGLCTRWSMGVRRFWKRVATCKLAASRACSLLAASDILRTSSWRSFCSWFKRDWSCCVNFERIEIC